MCFQVFLVFNSCSVHNCLSLPYFAFNRGIPPWDTVNTLYIEREEITGIVYLLVNLSYCLSVMIFSILESYFFFNHSSNRKHFSCLHNLIETREGLGEYETVMQTRDKVEGLQKGRDFSQPLNVYIRLCKYRKKVFYCFYKLTFLRKNIKLFVMALIKREILTSREV